MSFQNVRVLYKVLILVGVLVAATAVVAVTGKVGLGHLAHNIERVEQAEKAAIAGSVTSARVLELEVAELVLAANPAPDQVAAAEREIARIAGQIERTLGDLRQSADAEALALLGRAETALRAYRAGVDETVSRARRLGSGVTLSEAQREILDAALAGRARAKAALDALHAFDDLMEKRAHEIVEASNAEADQLTWRPLRNGLPVA